VGVYVKLNGDADADGVRVPRPAVVSVTVVALRKVLPLTVRGVVPHVLPVVAESVRAGGVAQLQATLTLPTWDTQPVAFLIVRVWFPSATPVKEAVAW